MTKEELFNKAQERFNSWAKMYSDPNVTVQQMYEDMTCSCYSGCMEDDLSTNSKPVIDQNFCFKYKGYDFELTSCNNITCMEQIPHCVLTDRYVCWMYGHKDIEGKTKEEVDEPVYWAPKVYLLPTWSWGSEFDLIPGAEVSTFMLEGIDKFLETFKE